MPGSITPEQIRQNNRLLVFQLIYQHRKISQQEICLHLHLSRPTVASLLTSLEKDGLICQGGFLPSDTAGRKASAYSINTARGIALGVEFCLEEQRLLAVDLYGEILASRTVPLAFHNRDSFFRETAEKLMDFKSGLPQSGSEILGVGFAVPGYISPDGQEVFMGRGFDCKNLKLSALSRYLAYPCALFSDVSATAASLMWASPELSQAVCLFLSRTLGAAVILDRKVLSGSHGHPASVEHLKMRPEGKMCYCGKKGCLHTLCSPDVLMEEGLSLDTFFGLIRKSDKASLDKWESYLKNLGEALCILSALYDLPVILSGELAPYLTEEDIAYLYDIIESSSPFRDMRDSLSISILPETAAAAGAALPYIFGFLGGIG